MKTKITVYHPNPRLNECSYYDTESDGLEALRDMRGLSVTCVLSTNVQTRQPDGSTPRETDIAITGNGSRRITRYDMLFKGTR